MGVFENSVSTPVTDSETFLLKEWNSTRDSGLRPTFGSVLNESEELRTEFIRGAEALGLVGRAKTLKPQQLLLVDTLNAGSRFTAVLLPRRSTKTTTLLAWLIGRGLSREDYLMSYGALTTGKKTRDRFLKDVVPILERVFSDPATAPFHIRKAAGQERIEFNNGSILQFVGPKGDEYRSDAYDLIVLDEAGEVDPETADDILSAALPTQDTKPEPMIVFAGTAARYRDGNPLWAALQDGRNKENNTGILEYSIDDDVTPEELAGWEPSAEHPEAHVRELVEEVHPGVGNLTSIEAVRTNFTKLKPEQFSAEYLGRFGTIGAASGIVNAERWNQSRSTLPLPSPPERFALAISVHPDQLYSSIVAAWRDDKGRAVFGVLEHKRGVKWLVPEAQRLALKYRTPIVHDTIGAVKPEVEQLQRIRTNKPRLSPQSYGQIKTAAALLIKEIDAGNFVHFDQPELNEAARLAKKRTAGPTSWVLGRGADEDDITPLEGAAMALRAFDDQPEKRKLPARMTL